MMPGILVYDVAAGESGALSVLMDFHREVLESRDKGIRWVFAVGDVPLREAENVTVLRFPWVKRSWAHRLCFDLFMARRLAKRYDIDIVFSMQNLLLPRVKQEQILYLHNFAPFVDYRFRLSVEPRLWVYRHILGPMMMRSIRKARRVIVQTQWMRKACIRYTAPERVTVIPPRVSREHVIPYRDTPENRRTFFYPALPLPYKNHMAVIDACRRLGAAPYSVIFTFAGDESPYARRVYRLVRQEGLPILFYGPLPRQKVFEMYAKSVLLFPSLAETFGMPLLEARLAGSFICASALPPAREVLAGYKNAFLFDPNDPGELAAIMGGMAQRAYSREDDFVFSQGSIIGAVTGT